MELSKKAKDFLNHEKIRKLIKDNNWEEFTLKLKQSLSSAFVKQIYQFFRKNGIDILPYIDFVPDYYFYNDESEKIILPKNIRKLNYCCFESSCARHILLPENIENIGQLCFYRTQNLMQIKIPKHVNSIDIWAFAYSSIKTIYFEGTEEQFLFVYEGNYKHGDLGDIEVKFI